MRQAVTDGIVLVERERRGECVAQMNWRILSCTTVVLSALVPEKSNWGALLPGKAGSSITMKSRLAWIGAIVRGR